MGPIYTMPEKCGSYYRELSNLKKSDIDILLDRAAMSRSNASQKNKIKSKRKNK